MNWIVCDGLFESIPNKSVDLMFDDGTILIDCLKQFDGDIWCKVLGTDDYSLSNQPILVKFSLVLPKADTPRIAPKAR
jgi:hypothetical protein